MAANQTVAESLNAHSLHAYFLRAGDPTVPIDFEVDPIRDGRSFSTRRVVARQNGEAIFNTSISYHCDEESVTHCFTMPRSRRRGLRRTIYRLPWFTTKPGDPNLIDLYQIERQRVTQYLAEEQPPLGRSWFRAVGPLPDDPTITKPLW